MYLILAEIVIWIVVAVGIRKLLKLNRALTVLEKGDSLSEHKLSIADLLIGENEIRDMSLPQAVELGRVNRVGSRPEDQN